MTRWIGGAAIGGTGHAMFAYLRGSTCVFSTMRCMRALSRCFVMVRRSPLVPLSSATATFN